MIKMLRLSFRGVFRNWRQSLAAFIAIASGFTSLVLFQGYMDDVEKMYVDANVRRGMMGHFFIENPDGDRVDELTQRRVEEILQADDRIETRVRFLNISGQVANGRNSMVFVGYGFDVEEGLKLRGPVWGWNTLAGRPLKGDDVEDSIVLGRLLMRILNCEVPWPEDVVNGLGGFNAIETKLDCPFNSVQLSLMTDKGQMNGIDFPVVGVTDVLYKEVDERFVSVPLRAAQSLMDTTDITRWAVYLKDGDLASAAVDDYNAKLEAAGLPVHAVRWQDHEFGDLYNQTMDLLGVFRDFVVSVIMIIACLSVFNTFMRNVSERSREIGTLRSIGFRPGQIATIFLGEAFFLAVTGCAIGAVLSSVIQGAINAANITYKPGIFSTPLPFRIDVGPNLVLMTALFLCVMVMVTSWISVRSSVKRKIVDLLGHV